MIITYNFKNANIALAHDWILGIAGTERVLKALHELFPQATIHTLIYKPEFTKKFLPKATIKPSFLQSYFKIIRKLNLLIPMMPLATESLNFSDYDIVLSSSFAYMKGIIVRQKTLHINYCHSPTRQLWDWHAEYQSESRLPKKITAFGQHIGRLWDTQAAMRVDEYIANSKHVQDRIQKYYASKANIIYPPVELGNFDGKIIPSKNIYFLIVSRLYKHKNIEVAVQAFNKMGFQLIIIGDGPEKKHLRRIAEKNILFLGNQSDESIRQFYRGARGFIMPQEEDFGIAAVEALGQGIPVLALARGGANEYIKEGVNGMFFQDPTEEVLAYGLKLFNNQLSSFDPSLIRASVERFSKERFKEEMLDFITKKAESL